MLYIALMVALLFVLIIVLTFGVLSLHHAIESRAAAYKLVIVSTAVLMCVVLMLISVNVLGSLLVER